MISTQEIELSAQDYFKLLAKIRFSTGWYIYLLPFVAAIITHFALPDQSMIVKFLLVYGTVNPLWILVYLYIHAQSDKVKSVSTKRHYIIDNENITGKHKDGTENQFIIKDIIRIKRFKTEMLMYFSQSEFIYIPYKSLTNSDLEEMLSILKSNNKL